MESSTNIRIKSFFQFGVVNFLRNILGLVRSKIIALIFGGAGIGVLGQYIAFFNLQSKVVMFGGTASMINSHHMAEDKAWDSKKVLFYHLLIIFITNLLVALMILVCQDFLNNLIFTGEVNIEFMLMIVIVGIFYSASTYLEMIIQAQKKFKVLSKGRNFSLIIALLSCVPIIYFFGLPGILYNMIILYLTSFIYFFLIFKNENLITFSLPKRDDFPIIKYILKVSLVDLIRSFLVVGAILIGKTIIVNSLGIVKNGYIQSIWSISNYINVLSTGFMVYYFPVINSQKDIGLLSEELNSSFKLLIYILFPLVLAIILLPKFLISLLYTSEFLTVYPFLRILMLAKFLELLYYFYTINFLGRNQFRNFIILEGLRSFFFILLMGFLVNAFEIAGAIWTIFLTEVFSVFIVIILLRNNVSIHLNRKNIFLYIKMLFLLILVAFLPFNDLLKLLFIILYSLFFLEIRYYPSLFFMGKK